MLLSEDERHGMLHKERSVRSSPSFDANSEVPPVDMKTAIDAKSRRIVRNSSVDAGVDHVHKMLEPDVSEQSSASLDPNEVKYPFITRKPSSIIIDS